MKFNKFAARATSLLLSIGMILSSFGSFQTVRAADHRDSGATDALPEGDITDVFAFVDPANANNVVLILPVNPFSTPSELPSARFSEEFLYQFKIDNGSTAQEDIVVQFNIHDVGAGQQYDVVIGTPTVKGPHGNVRIAGTTLCAGTVNSGAVAGPSMADSIVTDNGTGSKCYAGVADDSFQTDVAQAAFRIGANPNQAANAPNHTQDVFRGVTLAQSPSFGPLRGRPLRGTTSGVDGFGGYDTTIFAISMPKNLLRGTGIRVPTSTSTTLKPVNPSFIGAWGTVSRPTSESFDGYTTTTSDTYEQFERMGQQLTGTVFAFGPSPGNLATYGYAALTYAEAGLPPGSTPYLTTGEIKNFFNASGPETDNKYFARYIPDSLVSDGSLTGSLTNSIQGRATLLTAGGFAAPLGATGVSLFLPQLPNGIALNKNKTLQRQLLFPDYMRLNLDLIPTLPIENGAGAHNNGDPTLSAASWGLQNGRRPADDATDIVLRINREIDDVKFPDNLIVAGLGTGGVAALIPGSGAQGSRHTLQCNQLAVSITNPQIVAPCEDARIFLVLQGTDFIEQLPTDVENAANQVSQQRLLTKTFPYIGLNPVPGEPGTSNFPAQQ